MVLSVPRRFDAMTASWITAALASRCPGALVEGVEVGEPVDGTNRRARLHLSYRQGTGPASVFVKMHGRALHRLALLALGAWATEARLADSGVPLPLEHPLPFAAGVDRARLATVIVMDDVTTAGGRPNSAVAALGVDEVGAGLGALAALHAAYWDRPLPSAIGFLRPWRLSARWAPVSGASLRRGLRLLQAATPAQARPARIDPGHLEHQFRRWAAVATTGPQTLLHGDPHPGNTYSLPGRRTGFYDWQLARTGHWSHDVAYFLVASLDVESRRIHEESLLQGYLEALGRGGVTSPETKEAWARYRAAPAFGLATWLHTLSFGSFQPLEVCLATLERFSAAYHDLGTDRMLAHP